MNAAIRNKQDVLNLATRAYGQAVNIEWNEQTGDLTVRPFSTGPKKSPGTIGPAPVVLGQGKDKDVFALKGVYLIKRGTLVNYGGQTGCPVAAVNEDYSLDLTMTRGSARVEVDRVTVSQPAAKDILR